MTGAWRAPLRLKLKLSGSGLDADAQGTAELWAQGATKKDRKASVNLAVRHVNLAPLFDLKPSDPLMQDVSLSSRVSLAGSKWSFDDLDGTLKGSRVRGRLALTVGDEKNVDGEIGLDALDLAPAFALAIGSAGRDAADPLGSGLLKGWRGRIAFQALRGTLPGGGELRPVSGVLKSDGQSLIIDPIKGSIGGGEATASIEARPAASGMALNARVQFSGVDGAALRYRALAMPAGRVSLQMSLATPRPQQFCAGRRAVRKRHRNTGIRCLCRARSACVRCRDPCQRRRSGDRRQPATSGGRVGAVGRNVVGRVGANSVHARGRPASRRRDGARCQWGASHRVRRI